jgi:type II secretory pathway component GspD/PulD (secretin)
MNNEPAVMRVGSDGAVFEAAGQGPAAAAAPPADLTLTIVPQIGADGIVHMSVSPSIAEPGRPGRGQGSIVEADSVMRVRGGDTVVIAGLIREDRGAARRELVILITPTVVSAGASPAEGAR